MANIGNTPAYEEEIIAEEDHMEEQEIQVDDATEGNNVEHEYNGRPFQPPPPPPRIRQPTLQGHDPPGVIQRRGLGSPDFPARRQHVPEGSMSSNRPMEREYKFPLQPQHFQKLEKADQFPIWEKRVKSAMSAVPGYLDQLMGFTVPDKVIQGQILNCLI